MATGTEEFVDNTTADVFIPEIWSPLAIVARESNLVFADRVDTRYTDAIRRLGDTVHVPSVGNLTASTKTIASNTAIDYETVTETNVDIVVNVWEYAAMAVEDIIDVQANRDMMALYAGKLGYALALAVDDVLAGLVDNFGTNLVGTLAVENTDDDWLEARQLLNDADVPMEDRSIIISPKAETAMLKNDRFIHADYGLIHSDGPGTRVQQSYIGAYYRMPVYVSTNVEGTNAAGHDNTMVHKQALALAMQMSPKIGHMYDLDYFVDKVAVQQLYGTKEMRDDHGVFVSGA